ncbi:MAG: GspH/FimT family pseudopilin [Syntrophales bacterium]|nr:GspH/FimT family pseudopilin [Syntrophales bacterium]MDD5534028.1 GspH/FimT family pseudopilin [Syntrophales bacterium]
MRSRPDASDGFTLIDLLLVILIAGILAAIAIPSFSSFTAETRLNEAASELVSGLQYAANLSIRYQRPFGVIADASGNLFRVYDNRYRNDSSPHHDSDPPVDANGVVLNPLDKNWYLKDLDTMEALRGVAITSGGEVIFYPDGHSSSAGASFVLSSGAGQKTVSVDGIAGRIRVQ